MTAARTPRRRDAALYLLGSRLLPSAWLAVLALGAAGAAAAGGGAAHVLLKSLSAGLWLLFLVLVNVRYVPLRRGRAPLGVAAALASQPAFGAMGLLGAVAGGPRVVVADVLVAAGIAFSIASAATLGRCFGILPDVRGLVTRGPYRLVRHPLYLAELVALGGLAVASARPLAAAGAFAVCLAIQLTRSHYEESTLRAEFPEYAAYAARTPRLLPGLV